MPRVSVDSDTELFYQDLGDGRPVVFVHGGCMSHRVWEGQVDALLSAGYRVVTPDLRGHGRSDAPVASYDAELYADDIAALTDAVGIDEFALVGWSLGATVVSRFAKRYGDRLDQLVLVSSSIFRSIAAVESDETAANRLPIEAMLENQRIDRPRGMKRFVSGMFGNDPNEWAVHWLWSIGMETPMRVAIKTLEIYVEPDVGALLSGLAALDVPCAVFHGALDRAATVEEARTIASEVVADGCFVEFEDSGHVPFLEEQERFNDELLTVLDG